jgi:hypothetical protein
VRRFIHALQNVMQKHSVQAFFPAAAIESDMHLQQQQDLAFMYPG